MFLPVSPKRSEKPQLGLPARKMASAAALKPQRWAIWLGLHAFWVALFQWFEREQNMTKSHQIALDHWGMPISGRLDAVLLVELFGSIRSLTQVNRHFASLCWRVLQHWFEYPDK